MLSLPKGKKTYAVEIKDESGDIAAIWNFQPLTPKEIQDIIEKNTHIVWDGPNKRNQQRVEKPDYVGIAFDRFNAQLVSWDGVDGECNTENKRAFFDHDKGTVEAASDEFERQLEADKTRKGESEKN